MVQDLGFRSLRVSEAERVFRFGLRGFEGCSLEGSGFRAKEFREVWGIASSLIRALGLALQNMTLRLDSTPQALRDLKPA